VQTSPQRISNPSHIGSGAGGGGVVGELGGSDAVGGEDGADDGVGSEVTQEHDERCVSPVSSVQLMH
jgi:hypothetical protein